MLAVQPASRGTGLSGGPAVIELSPLRPVTLRPRVSDGYAFFRAVTRLHLQRHASLCVEQLFLDLDQDRLFHASILVFSLGTALTHVKRLS